MYLPFIFWFHKNQNTFITKNCQNQFNSLLIKVNPQLQYFQQKIYEIY